MLNYMGRYAQKRHQSGRFQKIGGGLIAVKLDFNAVFDTVDCDTGFLNSRSIKATRGYPLIKWFERLFRRGG